MHPQKVFENHIYYRVSNLQLGGGSDFSSIRFEAKIRDPDVFPFPGIWAIWVIGRVATWELMHATWETLLQVKEKYSYYLDFLEFYKTQGTIGFPVRIALLINIPKGFSSKMTLEVAKIGLKVSTQYML